MSETQKKTLNAKTPLLYPAITPTQIKQDNLLFTDKYLNFPLVLIGLNTQSGFIHDLNLLSGHKIAVRQGSFPYQYLRFHYPNISLLPVESIDDGLTQVQMHKALAIADNLPALNHALNKQGYNNMQVIGQGNLDFGFTMAASKQHPLLHSIINKALNQIDQAQRQAIYQKWLNPTKTDPFNYQRFWQLLTSLIILIFFIVILLIFNYRKQHYLAKIYELSYANIIDAESMKIIWSSQSFSQLSGYSHKELIGFPYLKLAGHTVSPEQIKQIYNQVVNQGQTWYGELSALRKNGEEYWGNLTLTPCKNLWGKVTRVLATRVDISDQKRIEAISITDELTGLYNRHHFGVKLPNEIKHALREEQGLCLAMIDLDFFKKINDEYGHQTGDEVLIEVATSVNAYFNRVNDYVFRIGGEEFFVITHFDNLRTFAVHLHNLQESICNQRIENRNAPLGYLTLSIGALYCSHECLPNANKILHYTDKLLYQSKENGRNRISFKVIDKSSADRSNPLPEAGCNQHNYSSFKELIDEDDDIRDDRST